MGKCDRKFETQMKHKLKIRWSKKFNLTLDDPGPASPRSCKRGATTRVKARMPNHVRYKMKLYFVSDSAKFST